MSDRWADLPEKLARLAEIGAEADLSTLVLREPATLAWLLGARVHVPQTLDTACLDVVLDLGSDTPQLTVVTNAIEAPRLQDTELADLVARWTVVPWWESREAALPRGPRVGSDRPLPGSTPVAERTALARRVLTTRQQDLIVEVAADAAAATTEAARRLQPASTEYGTAGVLAASLLDRELDPIVLLVAGDGRGELHRHPLPTSAPLGDRAMLVCCARRHGLVASVTRFISFGGLDDAAHRRYLDLLAVEQAFLDASRPGARLGDIVATGVAAYGRCGFDPQEWRRHHQGGLTGFVPREFPAHPGSTEVMQESSVVAWNPSGATWKVEDTCLVTDAGPKPLVHDPAWPTVQIGGRDRPDVLTA